MQATSLYAPSRAVRNTASSEQPHGAERNPVAVAPALAAPAEAASQQAVPESFAEAATGCHLSPNVVVPAAGPGGPDRETGGQFTLAQNVPDPFHAETTIPFTLANPADVRLDLFDPQGRKVAGVVRHGLGAGPHHIGLNLHGLGLPAGAYAYELKVTNRTGVYRQRRTLTAVL